MGGGNVRVLVTGGAGFIGSAVCRYLIGETEAAVVNLDKLTYAGNLHSLETIETDPRYRFVPGDICDAAALDKIFRQFEPGAVMHLAAESHVDLSITGSADFIQTNVVGTHTLLEAARRYWEGFPETRRESFRFLHVSTDEVYGSLGPDGPFAETTPYSPYSPYAASKASADHLVNTWHHTYELLVLITNCSNNYGPYHFPEKLIPQVTINALEEKPLPVYGRGDNIRDWLYVEDHARALDLVLRRGGPGEKYNIGGRNERTNLEVVEAICDRIDALKPAVTVSRRRELTTFVADRAGHDRRCAIDASKLENELGWRAREDFETGLRKTVEWYLANEAWWRPLRKGVYGGERLDVIAGGKGQASPIGKRRADDRPILIVGRYGQVARALDARGFGDVPHVALGRNVADLTDMENLSRAFAVHKPRLVVNAPAYTSVDRAETERELAFAVNRDGVAHLAGLCAASEILLIHMSTDYVFDGSKRGGYAESDPVAPLNVYGASKAEGEATIREVLREHVILRTSWVYSSTGNNFVKTMLGLGESHDRLTVVDDQRGSPTFAPDIADAIGTLVEQLIGGGEYGTYHLASGGTTSWCGFARDIFERAAAYNVKAPKVVAISTKDYPTPAKRPANSVLDCVGIMEAYGISLPAWQGGLDRCLAELLGKAALARVS